MDALAAPDGRINDRQRERRDGNQSPVEPGLLQRDAAQQQVSAESDERQREKEQAIAAASATERARTRMAAISRKSCAP